MKSPDRMNSIGKDSSGCVLRITGSRPRTRIAVEHLEPRVLLSHDAVGRPNPDDALSGAVLRVVEVGPVDVNTKFGITPNAGPSTAAASTASTPVVPIPHAVESADFAVTRGLIAASDDSAIDRIPVGATSFLVTFRVLSPQTQATWSLVIRDGDGREIGSVTVPPGQGGVTVEISSPGGGETRPITLTVTADPVQPGRPAGAYVLEIAAEDHSIADPSADAGNDQNFVFIGLPPDWNELQVPEEPTRSPTTQGPSGPAPVDTSTAPPSSLINSVSPKPTSGGGAQNGQSGEPSSEEQADAADPERSDQDGVVVQGDSLESMAPASSARQLVDAPGGLPGMGATAAPRAVPARRLAGEGRLGPPGIPTGPVVVSTLLAAGLIAPNVLLLGSPQPRPSRPEWRRSLQRRPSA
jgi:hypothetical protein